MDRLVRFNVVATSGRAVEAAGDVDTLLLDKTGTITFGNRPCAALYPLPGIDERDLAEAAVLASLGDDTPEGRSILAFVRDRFGIAAGAPGRRDRGAVQRQHPHLRPRRRRAARGARARWTALARRARGTPARPPSRQRSTASPAPAARRSPSRRRPPAGRDRAEGHRQARHPRPLRRAAPDGHPHRHGHRRQPRHRRRHRHRGRRRRLPRRGHAAGQARLHPPRPGRRPPGRDVRRRHQRRAGAGAGRCRRRHADRHPGGARGRQHGRPRQRPDQADRGGRDRQAAADHPRRADHLQHRQRRLQIFRHPAGDLRRDLPGARRAERHAAGHAAERDPVGGDLQRADHRRPGAARAARRPLPPRSAPRRCCAATCWSTASAAWSRPSSASS